MEENQVSILEESQKRLDAKNREVMIDRMTNMLATKKGLEEKLEKVNAVIADLNAGKAESYNEFRDRQGSY